MERAANTAEPDKLREMFLAALRLPVPERLAFVQAECAEADELRRQVERLLQAHEELGTVAPSAVNGTAVTQVPPQATGRPGDVLAGRYKLLQLIGEGGMGEVWLAEQTEPVRRQVAVKLIKAGMDSRAVLARFEAERQALALMDHPNIARVLDAGTTGSEPRMSVSGEPQPQPLTDVRGSGRPFFVMELVKGKPITKYCDENRLTPRQRLELFAFVCHAVQHAHQKGIIHRDLKPSNVLVGLYDGRPMVKVIDFGVAKATSQRLTEKTLFTAIGTVVGTLEYMSPEQAELDNVDVDTRSDIYSLGVLLYELLTGSTPFTKQEMQKAGMLEMLRVIREQEPSKPSTKLSTADGLPTLAANRGTEPAKLTKLVRGELDWIVMKALEKDRNRRYETANSFAIEMQRYLADEPVAAGPPSAGYRLRKFVRRNRGAALASGVVLAVLVAGIVVSSLLAVWARQAEADERSAKEAEAEQRKHAEAVAGVMQSAFEDLDPGSAPEDLRQHLLSRLSAATTQLDADRAGDPLTRAKLRLALGKTFIALGESGRGIPLLEQAREAFDRHYGPDSPDALACGHAIATGLGIRLEFAKAIPIIEQTLTGREARLGPGHDDTIATLILLGDTFSNTGDLRTSEVYQRAWDRARAARGDDYALTQQAKHGVGSSILHDDVGRGIRLMSEVFDWHKTRMGADHPTTLGIGKSLMYAHVAMMQYDQALPINQLLVQGHETRDGPNHYRTLFALNRLQLNYQALRRANEEEQVAKELLARSARITGSDASQIALMLSGLGQGLLARNRYADAERPLRDALAAHERANPEFWETFYVRSLLGAALAGQMKYAEAEPLLQSGFNGLKARANAIPRPFRARLRDAGERLVKLYDAWGKPDEAAKWRTELEALKKAS